MKTDKKAQKAKKHRKTVHSAAIKAAKHVVKGATRAPKAIAKGIVAAVRHI